MTWTAEIAARLLGHSPANPLVQILSLGWIAPAAAATIVRRWGTREGFADAGLAPRVRVAWRHYLAAWLGPLAFAGAAVRLAAVLGLWKPTLAPLNQLVPGLPWWGFLALLMLVVPLLAPLYWGEEFGWTSYLRRRRDQGRGERRGHERDDDRHRPGPRCSTRAAPAPRRRARPARQPTLPRVAAGGR